MAREENLLNQLVTLVRRLDDDAYTALASKGLLRRARKEIEKGTPIFLGEPTGDHITIRVGDACVEMPEIGPSGARCSCPSPTCCHHILAACLQFVHLAGATSETAEEAPPSTSDKQEWIDLSLETLRKWDGIATFRKALDLASEQVREVKETRITFKTGIECHLIPGAGLDGILTNATAKLKTAYIIAAILAWQAAHGRELPPPESHTAASQLKTDTLAAVQSLIEEVVELGFNHLSDSAQQRFQTLAVHCRADRLYRPASELESCASDIQQLRTRHALASSTRLLDRLCRLYALAHSIQAHGPSAPRSLTGVARSHYESGTQLELVGMGAYPWTTDSGYQGITAHFWSPADQEFYSWSDVRPQNTTDGFTPNRRFSEAAPWAGGGSLSRVVASTFLLNRPRINAERRLGVGDSCSVGNSNPTIATNQLPEPITSWQSFEDEQEPTTSMGLQRRIPLDDLFLIRPTRWDQPIFDEIKQQLRVEVRDDQGESLNLVLPYTPLTETPIRHLEQYPFRDATTLVLTYLRKKPDKHLYPIALLDPGAQRVLPESIFFTEPPAATDVSKHRARSKAGQHARLLVKSDATQIEQFLAPLDTLLRHQAESGTHRPANQVEWQRIHRLIDTSGLTQLASLTGRIAAQPIPSPRTLLVCRYLQLLHQDV